MDEQDLLLQGLKEEDGLSKKKFLTNFYLIL